jgi:hypothetical protein
MTPKALKETLSSLVTQKLPAFIWGPPGIGKSSIVKEISEDMGVKFIDLRLTLLDPSDLKGIPFLDGKQAIWAAPNFLPQADHKGGILFLDELNSAPPSVQAAAYQLILDRRIGDYELPVNWSIIAAGNREGDRGVTHKIPSPLANRFVHFEMEHSINDWKAWAFREEVENVIVSFISLNHEALFTFNPKSKEKAFATPRSWEFVDTILKSTMKEEHLFDAISGAIGAKLAAEFLAYKNESCELPAFQEIFEGRSKHYPKDECALHVAATVLVIHVLRDPDKSRLNHLLRYTLGIEAEFAIMIVRDLQAQGIRFDRLEAWKEWSDRFSLQMEQFS